MCNATRNIGPCGRTLCLNKIGNIIDRHHIGIIVRFRVLYRNLHVEVACSTSTSHADLFAMHSASCSACDLEGLSNFRRDTGKAFANCIL
ncbi:hypothetical protein FQZ97_1170530 [compost metagenome]